MFNGRYGMDLTGGFGKIISERIYKTLPLYQALLVKQLVVGRKRSMRHTIFARRREIKRRNQARIN